MQAYKNPRQKSAHRPKTGKQASFYLHCSSSWAPTPPLATDMYLPALPQMAANFNTSDSTASLTLVLFFVFFAFSTLLWGPVSEKYGRKPSLIAGIALFTIASAGCVVSATVYQMIIWRVIQAIASGAPLTISLAIVQDTYTGDAKKKILAILGALTMVAPVISPSLGFGHSGIWPVADCICSAYTCGNHFACRGLFYTGKQDQTR